MVINVNKYSSVKISDFLLAIRYYEIDFLCQTVKEKLFFKTWFDKKKATLLATKMVKLSFLQKRLVVERFFLKTE